MKVVSVVAPLFALLMLPGLIACDDGGDDDEGAAAETGEGDGDGDPSGDGDGDPTTGDGDGDATGDGDGDPTTGDGDGDPTSGDGDPTTGDGDGDPGACGVDPGWGPVGIGQPVKHLLAYDHLGAEVSICDFAGTPIVIDVAAVWCGPCQGVSAWLAGQPVQDPFGGNIGTELRTMVNAGTIKWLTYLVQDANSGNALVAQGAAWDTQYHHDNIPVLTEMDTWMLPGYFNFGCWPTAWTIDPEMNFMGVDDCQTWTQLQTLVDTY
jgi:hypothetical protein